MARSTVGEIVRARLSQAARDVLAAIDRGECEPALEELLALAELLENAGALALCVEVMKVARARFGAAANHKLTANRRRRDRRK